MTKTKEELNQLKVEYESFNIKLKELDDDELKQVTGGTSIEDSYVTGERNESEYNHIQKNQQGSVEKNVNHMLYLL